MANLGLSWAAAAAPLSDGDAAGRWLPGDAGDGAAGSGGGPSRRAKPDAGPGVVSARRAKPERALRLRMAAARSEIATVASGEPAAMLAVPPGLVRAVAARAIEATRVAAHLRARGNVPAPLDLAAARAAMASFAELRDARARRAALAHDRHRLLAFGNGAALVCLLGAGLLLVAGVPPSSSVVAVWVALAAAGPLVALTVGTARLTRAHRALGRHVNACSAALAAAGVETIGELHARTFLWREWSRRRAEAARAARTEERALAAWHELVGDVDPARAEELLAAASRLRAAHLRLLGLHLTHLLASNPHGSSAHDEPRWSATSGPEPASVFSSDDAEAAPGSDGAEAATGSDGAEAATEDGAGTSTPTDRRRRPSLALVPAPPRPTPLLLWALAGAERRSQAAAMLRQPFPD